MAITLTRGSKKTLPQMKMLWLECFPDDTDFVSVFFEKFYRPRKSFLLFEGEKLVSMLYYMDVKMKYDGRKIKCAYLYGVATKLSERRQGHFKRLHDAFLDEMKSKNYDAVMTIPESELLFSLYKDMGYTLPLRRCEYELTSMELTPVENLREVWLYKKELHKKCRLGLSVLESEEQFYETVRDHRIFAYDGGYLAFYPDGSKFTLYGIISQDPLHAPASLVHYERSALVMDVSGKLNREKIEKDKPILAFLLS